MQSLITMEVLDVESIDYDSNKECLREYVVDDNGIEYDIEHNREGKCFATRIRKEGEDCLLCSNSFSTDKDELICMLKNKKVKENNWCGQFL